MKDIEFITRIQVNGEKRELTKEEASELILRRVKEKDLGADRRASLNINSKSREDGNTGGF